MSVQRRNKVIIDLQITYSGYKVIEPDTMSNRRTRISNSRRILNIIQLNLSLKGKIGLLIFPGLGLMIL